MAIKNCIVWVGATIFKMFLIRSFDAVNWNSHFLDYSIILMGVV